MGMKSTTLCGLDCSCDTLPSGQRLCVLAEPKSVRDQRRAEAYDQAPVEATSSDTYSVVYRVMHRGNKGEDKAHAVYGRRGLSLQDARHAAVEAGTIGIFDGLMYYPPGRVLTVRISPDA